MVKEQSNGLIVYNQPAGHLKVGESLVTAAMRETLEETGWQIKVSHFLGVYHYTSPHNGVSYVRHCFIAEPLIRQQDARPDQDIIAACWLTRDEIKGFKNELRSPMVWQGIEDYLRGVRYPLTLITDGGHD